MASGPRCPAPAGSSGDGPMGSWTIASGANRLSQPARSFAFTAACDRRARSRAVHSSFSIGHRLLGSQGSTPKIEQVLLRTSTAHQNRNGAAHAKLSKSGLKIAQNYESALGVDRTAAARVIIWINPVKQGVIVRRPLTCEDSFRRR